MTNRMPRTILSIAETLGTTLKTIRELAAEHPHDPLPDSLLLPLGDVSAIERMTRRGIDHDDAQDYLEGLREEYGCEKYYPVTLLEVVEHIQLFAIYAERVLLTLPEEYRNRPLLKGSEPPF